MAYRRWSNSNWYIYWHVMPDHIEEPHLAIWHNQSKETPVLPLSDVIDLRDALNEFIEDTQNE